MARIYLLKRVKDSYRIADLDIEDKIEDAKTNDDMQYWKTVADFWAEVQLKLVDEISERQKAWLEKIQDQLEE